jgi:hypothetical protein
VLHILTDGEPSVTSARPAALGVAIEGGTGCGRVAYALWHRIAAFARMQDRSASLLLAYVIAHEIGHLLLPHPSHGPGGLMASQWRRSDLDDAEQGRLRFTAHQARTMRQRLAAESLLRIANR